MNFDVFASADKPAKHSAEPQIQGPEPYGTATKKGLGTGSRRSKHETCKNECTPGLNKHFQVLVQCTILLQSCLYCTLQVAEDRSSASTCTCIWFITEERVENSHTLLVQVQVQVSWLLALGS